MDKCPPAIAEQLFPIRARVDLLLEFMYGRKRYAVHAIHELLFQYARGGFIKINA